VGRCRGWAAAALHRVRYFYAVEPGAAHATAKVCSTAGEGGAVGGLACLGSSCNALYYKILDCGARCCTCHCQSVRRGGSAPAAVVAHAELQTIVMFKL
jgi:hypothetical protein